MVPLVGKLKKFYEFSQRLGTCPSVLRLQEPSVLHVTSNPATSVSEVFRLTSYFVIILFHLQLSLGGSTGRDGSKGWFPAAYGVQSKTEQPRVLPACDNFQ